jgi:2'-5' RNA ligase
MRTFIAVPLSAEVRSTLAEVQEKLRSLGGAVRWSAASSIHLTFKFLGEIDPALLPELTESLRLHTQAERPFSLHVNSLGAFPDLRHPRVIWCGLAGDVARLETLQDKVELACIQAGFAPEEHPFRPHLTLGRVRLPGNLAPLVDCMKSHAPLESAFSVARYHIYQSVLKPQGALHSVLTTIELKNE